MQVFIVGSVLETAKVLDPKRRAKQIIEVRQILEALNGSDAWSNHPAVLQYRGRENWLRAYYGCLDAYVKGELADARVYSNLADAICPEWHTQEYFDQMKRRLFEKDEEHYKQWAHLGKSQENWYFVDNEWRKYVNGKRVE